MRKITNSPNQKLISKKIKILLNLKDIESGDMKYSIMI